MQIDSKLSLSKKKPAAAVDTASKGIKKDAYEKKYENKQKCKKSKKIMRF